MLLTLFFDRAWRKKFQKSIVSKKRRFIFAFVMGQPFVTDCGEAVLNGKRDADRL